jgi:hypothetical protein
MTRRRTIQTLNDLNAIYGGWQHWLSEVLTFRPQFSRRQTYSQLLSRYAEITNLEQAGPPGILERIPEIRGALAHRIRPPRDFSFLSNPEDTIRFLNRLVTLAHGRTSRLYVDQFEQLDSEIGAGLLLNVVASAAAKDFLVDFAGMAPRDLDTRALVWAAGLPSIFRPKESPPDNLHIFKTRRGRYRRFGSGNSYKEILGTRLIAYVRECFARNHCVLSTQEARDLAEAVGEVLTNAEDHGDGEWWLAAYMIQSSKRRFGELQVAIFNFGDSIATTMRGMEPSIVRTEIEELVSHHDRAGNFCQNWTEDSIWTLWALQEGVSRLATDDRPRGTGLARLLESFYRMGQTTAADHQPRLCLLSGNTYFRFDERFQSVRNKEDRQVVFLNTEKDFLLPPSAGAALHLTRPFPGTLISFSVFLDEQQHTPHHTRLPDDVRDGNQSA